MQDSIIEEGMDSAHGVDSTAKMTAMMNEWVCRCPGGLVNATLVPSHGDSRSLPGAHLKGTVVLPAT